jgi:probable addiction module antidote protein
MAKTKLKITPYDSAEYLKNKKDVAAYLDAALEDGDPALIRHALNVIARARGMTQIARDSGVTRESLYRALGENGNPEFTTVLKVVHALGMRLRTRPA